MQEEQIATILDFIKSNNLNFRTRTELATNISQGLGYDFTTAYSLIGEMLDNGDLLVEGNDKLATIEALGLRKGVLVGNSRGFAFCKFIDDGETPDVFIPPVSLKTALHNDTVLVKVRKKDDKTEGQVVKDIKRNDKNIMGTQEIVNEQMG